MMPPILGMFNFKLDTHKDFGDAVSTDNLSRITTKVTGRRPPTWNTEYAPTAAPVDRLVRPRFSFRRDPIQGDLQQWNQ